jgi:2-isopropylmalate synthase
MSKKDKVYIFDTTLRDGEQSLPSSLSVNQKLTIARQLTRLNVDIIEAGFPVSSPGDFLSVQTIAEKIHGPIICGLARTMEKDILKCAEAIKKAERGRIHTFIGTSAIHSSKKLRKSEDQIIDMAVKSIRLARKYCGDVQFSPEDAGRTGIDFLCRIVETAIKSGATTINIPDTVGYTTPELFADIIKSLFNRVPNIDKAVIAVHCHDDLGMATANSITAIKYGVRQLECTVNGIGERAGNAALEELVMIVKLRKDYLKVSTDINTKEIIRSSKLVRDICGVPVQPNKAVVGSNAFAHSSGIHQDGVLKSKKTYEIMTPQSIGLRDNTINLTSRSGSHMVKARLLSLGYEEDEIDLESFTRKFTALADKKGTVYDDDLITLMESKSSKDMEDIYIMEYLNVTSGKGTVPTATVRIISKGKVYQEAACGDGAVDATTKAIDRIAGYSVKIKDFHINSRTQGREAFGIVKIIADTEKGILTGSGTSTDIVEASALAYLDIINKIARMIKFNKNIKNGV